LPAADATKIGIGIAQALAVLHRADVVHRDVNPATCCSSGKRAGQAQ
jgi:serine/threonine protein kinase